MIVLDTSVLSLAFRRRATGEGPPPAVEILRRLIVEDGSLVIPGVVLQELLSGARTDEQMDRLGAAVAGFRILLATREHHLEAARLANACRRAGVTAATVDCLIAAQTVAAGAELLTTDNDFTHMAGCCPLRLVPLA